MPIKFISATPAGLAPSSSVLTTLPVALFVVVPLVFVVTSGEIDLSFPATMGFASWVFALVVQAGYDPFLGIAAAIVTGMTLGFLVGVLVVYAGLSSLIATLGMNFLLRGLIQIINEGKSTALTTLAESWAYTIFFSQVSGIPVQIFWAIASWFSPRCSSTATASAPSEGRRRQSGQCAADGHRRKAGKGEGIRLRRHRRCDRRHLSTMINFTWWPTAGDGYLLPVLASVFVGGTPTWGGVGTVVGGAIGALTVSFIQTGVVAAGLSAASTCSSSTG